MRSRSQSGARCGDGDCTWGRGRASWCDWETQWSLVYSPFGPPEKRQKRLTLMYRPTCLWVSRVWDWDRRVTCYMHWHLSCIKLNYNLLVKSWTHDLKSGFIINIKSWTHDLKSGFIISNHNLMIWNQDLFYQIINLWFEIRIYYIKSWTYDLNQDLLYQIINAWFEIKIYYIIS